MINCIRRGFLQDLPQKRNHGETDMGRFKEKMYRFMYGRYGTDNLYNFITYFTIVLILADIVVAAFVPEGIVQALISLAFMITIMLLFIWNIYRTMSRQIAKRRRENERYLKIKRAIKRFFSGNTSKSTRTFNRDDATYVFRDCTKCGSTLRLPRRVGKNKVKCPRCSHSFYVKAKKYNYKKQR